MPSLQSTKTGTAPLPLVSGSVPSQTAATCSSGLGASSTSEHPFCLRIGHTLTLRALSSQFVFAVLNTGTHNHTENISLLDVFLDQGTSFGSGTFTLFDLWQKDDNGNWGRNIGDFQGSVPVTVGPHQTKVYRATPASNSRRALEEL